MFRDNSKNSLARTPSKQKIKQTIRIAMGKEPSQPLQQPNSRPRRSSSTKSLRSFHHSTVSMQNQHLETPIQRNNSQSVFSHVGNKWNVSGYEKIAGAQNKDQNNRVQNIGREGKVGEIGGVQWWHYKGWDIDSQSRTSINNGNKQHMQYFAYHNKLTNKKHILLAVQNDFIYVGDSQLTIYLINTEKLTLQTINKKTQKMSLKNLAITQILVIGTKTIEKERLPKQQYSQKSISVITKEVKYYPKLEKLVLQKMSTYRNKFFDALTREAIEREDFSCEFYLCLHIGNTNNATKKKDIKNESESILNKIMERKIYSEMGNREKAKTKIYQHALLKYKK